MTPEEMAIHNMKVDNERMRRALLQLLEIPGMSEETRWLIKGGLGTPYPFCSHVEKCCAAHRCVNDPVCCD